MKPQRSQRVCNGGAELGRFAARPVHARTYVRYTDDQPKGGVMSATTIQIPSDHVEAIRRSLLGRRGDAQRPDEVDDLLAQLAGGAAHGARPYELTGSRTVIWNAVYDSLCMAAEQLAEDCNEYWRDAAAPEAARAAVAAVGARGELLIGRGAPPGS
jgi:hypothetical protein